jgi:hypothetical protein
MLFHCLVCCCGKQKCLLLDLAALISFLCCASYIESTVLLSVVKIGTSVPAVDASECVTLLIVRCEFVLLVERCKAISIKGKIRSYYSIFLLLLAKVIRFR